MSILHLALRAASEGPDSPAMTELQKRVSTGSRPYIVAVDFDGTLCDADCIKLIGIARNTYYKYKRELRNAISI